MKTVLPIELIKEKAKKLITASDVWRVRVRDALAKKPRRLNGRPVYTNRHFEVRWDGEPSFWTPDGQCLIDRVAVCYSLASIHNLSEPLRDPQRISLDRVEGLCAGDRVMLAMNMYGGSALSTYQFTCRIKSVGLSSIEIDKSLPEHFMRYHKSLIVLKRDSLVRADIAKPPEVEYKQGKTELGFVVPTDHFRLDAALIVEDDSASAEFRLKASYLRPCRLFNLTIELDGPLKLSQLYLKNRHLRDLSTSGPSSDVWLWKEGCRWSGEEADCILLPGPETACTEIVTPGRGFSLKTLRPRAKPTVAVSLEHYQAQRYRRHSELFSYDFSSFEDLSLPAFEAGEEKTYRFNIFAGISLPPPPRLLLAPKGFRAVLAWTEHADNASLATSRAAYFGHESISDAGQAIGGFVGNGHVVTKSIFHSNPRNFGRRREGDGESSAYETNVAFQDGPAYRDFLDQLDALGHEICLHAVNPDDGHGSAPSANLGAGFQEIYERYRSRTYIDHAMQMIRAAVGWQGTLPNSSWSVRGVMEELGLRYIWSWPSPDFMAKKKGLIDLLHTGGDDSVATPLYWRHRALPKGTLIWGANESRLDAFTEKAIEQLIADRGVSVVQHYFSFIPSDKYQFGFIEHDKEGCFVATRQFNSVLATLAQWRDKGELYIATIGEILDHWTALEAVRIHLNPPNEFQLTNTGPASVEGLAFAVEADRVVALNAHADSRKVDNETFVWLDLPAGATARFRVEGWGKIQ